MMKKVTTVGEHQIFQKGSGRYAVQGANRQWVNGEDKTKVLLEAGLIKRYEKQAVPAEAPAEAAEGEAAAE